MTQLCPECNKLATEWLRREFNEMHKGPTPELGCSYMTFISRLQRFIKGSTGNVNTVMYLQGMLEYMKTLTEKKSKEAVQDVRQP